MDMWSLGVIFYEIAALKLPFFAESIYDLTEKISKAEYESLPATYSAEMHAVIASLLSLEPSQRLDCPTLLQLSPFERVRKLLKKDHPEVYKPTKFDRLRNTFSIIEDISCEEVDLGNLGVKLGDISKRSKKFKNELYDSISVSDGPKEEKEEKNGCKIKLDIGEVKLNQETSPGPQLMGILKEKESDQMITIKPRGRAQRRRRRPRMKETMPILKEMKEIVDKSYQEKAEEENRRESEARKTQFLRTIEKSKARSMMFPLLQKQQQAQQRAPDAQSRSLRPLSREFPSKNNNYLKGSPGAGKSGEAGAEKGIVFPPSSNSLEPATRRGWQGYKGNKNRFKISKLGQHPLSNRVEINDPVFKSIQPSRKGPRDTLYQPGKTVSKLCKTPKIVVLGASQVPQDRNLRSQNRRRSGLTAKSNADSRVSSKQSRRSHNPFLVPGHRGGGSRMMQGEISQKYCRSRPRKDLRIRDASDRYKERLGLFHMSYANERDHSELLNTEVKKKKRLIANLAADKRSFG